MTPLRLLVLAAGTRVGQNILATFAGRRDHVHLVATTSVADEPGPFGYDTVHLVPETRYDELVNGIDAAVWEGAGPTGAAEFLSDHVVDLLGYGLDQIRDRAFFESRVHPDDLGRVIGRGGRTARALRTVVGALSSEGPVRVDVVDVARR